MRKIILSIVIPTRNRVEMLRGVLQSIAAQKAEQNIYEVLVIDNGSTDGTRTVLKEFQEKIQNLRYIYDDRPGLHVGRNRGITESQGELIGYLDDDVILFPDWINTVIKAFDDAEVMHVCGSVLPYDMSLMTKEFMSKYAVKIGSYLYVGAISCFWERGLSESDMRSHIMKEKLFFGGNSIFRKRLLHDCYGFHPDSMPYNLLMYRGDGETYVGQFICEHKMKSMYYAQASVYHMIDINRVKPAYIRYMYFRNGISSMYTTLRNGGCREGLKCLGAILYWKNLKRLLNEDTRYAVFGEVYLLVYYILYPRVQRWVHKKAYF